jgi:hypothetical protein
MPFSSAGACSSKYLRDEDHVLYEFPLLTDLGKDAGYVIISADETLPPVLSYSHDGPVLSAQLRDLLQATLPEVSPDQVRWFYFSALDLVARLPTSEGETPVYVTIPRFSPTRLAKPIRRNPLDCWTAEHVRGRWEALSEPIREHDIVSQLPNSPKRYNQSCSGYPLSAGDASDELPDRRIKLSEQDGGNLCAWRGISGCAPVAWAVLASWWKQDPRAAAKIWPGSTCWSLEWSSSYFPQDPTLCPEVSSSIWGFHNYCSTSFDGQTDLNNTYSGFGLFRDRYGLPWSWAGDWTYSFDGANAFNIARREINGGQAVMYCATGPWQQYGGAGNDGHCTVAYGFNDSSRKILICLGWGYLFSDVWIDPMDFSSGAANLIYVNGFAASEKKVGDS